jgi:agmatinase
MEDVDAAVVGVPLDTTVSFRPGGRFGPSAVRAASAIIRRYNPLLGVDPFSVLSCVDYGDVDIVPGDTQRSFDAIEATIRPLVEAGIVPVLIGGDHSCTLPHLRSFRSRTPLAVVVFDAHTDASSDFFGDRYNHGTWMRRAIEEGLVDVEHSLEVGLRGSIFSPEDWTRLTDLLGLTYLTTRDVVARGPEATAQAIRERIGDRPTYVSFDIDVVDPAFAPGTGVPEAGGISSNEALEIIRFLGPIDLVGFDVVEVIPAYDPAGVTANLAANLAYELLSLVALRRSAADAGPAAPAETAAKDV